MADPKLHEYVEIRYPMKYLFEYSVLLRKSMLLNEVRNMRIDPIETVIAPSM